MTIREELHINCPREVAFDLMADVRRLTDWNEGASRAELMTDEPIGKGSRFVTVNRGQEMVSTITGFQRPDRIDFAVTSKRMDVAATFAFTDSGGGTTLVITFEPHAKGIMAVLFPLLSPIIRRDLAKQHLKFKAYCEGRSRAEAA